MARKNAVEWKAYKVEVEGSPDCKHEKRVELKRQEKGNRVKISICADCGRIETLLHGTDYAEKVRLNAEWAAKGWGAFDSKVAAIEAANKPKVVSVEGSPELRANLAEQFAKPIVRKVGGCPLLDESHVHVDGRCDERDAISEHGDEERYTAMLQDHSLEVMTDDEIEGRIW